MSGTMKLVIAALIGAGVIAGAGAVYVFVIAPAAVQHEIIPATHGALPSDADMRSSCEAVEKDLGATKLPPACKQALAGGATSR